MSRAEKTHTIEERSRLQEAERRGLSFHLPWETCPGGCAKCARQRASMKWPAGITLYCEPNLYTEPELSRLLEHYNQFELLPTTESCRLRPKGQHRTAPLLSHLRLSVYKVLNSLSQFRPTQQPSLKLSSDARFYPNGPSLNSIHVSEVSPLKQSLSHIEKLSEDLNVGRPPSSQGDGCGATKVTDLHLDSVSCHSLLLLLSLSLARLLQEAGMAILKGCQTQTKVRILSLTMLPRVGSCKQTSGVTLSPVHARHLNTTVCMQRQL